LQKGVGLTCKTRTSSALDAAIQRVLAVHLQEEVLPAPPGPAPSLFSPGEAQASPADDPSEILDLAALREHVENDMDLMKELVELFLESMPQQLAAVHAAATAGNSHNIERTAHALKVALRSLYAQQAAAAAQTLESIGRAGELEKVPAALAELDVALNTMVPVLNEFPATVST
jgi:two-component system, sensor histidine kinase and response regulator